LNFFGTVLEKYSNVKYYEKPSSGNRVIPCGWTYVQAGIKKLIFAFRHFTKASKIHSD